MSASLVGSEMCIRDSPYPKCSLSSRAVGSLSFTRGAIPAGGGKPLEPVSYTHLTLPTICSV
eukprot:6107326-Alexandrium_andersonii.AAC.1